VAWTSPSPSPTASAPAGTWPAKAPRVLRWALHEAAMCAARPSAPDHPDYLQVRQRLGGKPAALSVARKLAREAYHTLRELGDQALVPAEFPTAA